METPLAVWQQFRIKYGEYEARRRLRWINRQHKEIALCGAGLFRTRREGLALVMELVHTWPGLSPIDARTKYAALIRSALTEVRRQRERILGFC